MAHSSKTGGPALVFARLWETQGLPEIIRCLAGGRKFGFDPERVHPEQVHRERVTFAMALQRLCSSGSDLQGSGWVEAEGFEQIALQHLYRMTAFLAEIREDLEVELFGGRPVWVRKVQGKREMRMHASHLLSWPCV